MTAATDLEARAAAVVAKWEHGCDEHRKWLRGIAVPDLVAFAESVREEALREAAKLAEDVRMFPAVVARNVGRIAARNIRALISSPPSAPPADVTRPLRLCGYCSSWHSRPCGQGCCWQPTDPTLEERIAALALAEKGT